MENFQDYIESGILEQYALGELSVAEQAAVEARAAAHPEIRAELEQVQAALGFYAEAHAIIPSAAMRERILTNVMAQIAGPVANSSLRTDVDVVAQATSRPGSVASAPQPVATASDVILIL